MDAVSTKELRLALVCYGGSSLAVYMHGVTKELHRLVKGSALLEAGEGDTATPSERVYGRLLDELAERSGEQLRTRVVVDVIAGTSAGGINGVCLAKALAHNLPQDEFRNLWFERGDIDGLLAAPRWLPTRVLKGVWVALHALKKAPLRGDLMARWIYDAFHRMDEKGSTPASLPTLLPDRHKLELFVTVTDFYGYGRQVPYADPNPIYDRRHRHLLAFRFGGDDRRDDFDHASNGALTFAARTTSSIPGVFPPVSFEALKGWLGEDRPVDFDRLEQRFFRLYELAKFKPASTWFVDGGVLDNKPFGPAIDAIRERPADVQVDRRLLYLEPDPSSALRPSTRPKPSTVTAALGGLTGLPRTEPILDDLVEVGALNERVRRIRDIIETSWDTVEKRVREIVGPLPEIPNDPADPKLAEIRKRTEDEAQRSAGFSYATYVRLKISGVVDRYAETACGVCDLPADSTHALLDPERAARWAEERKLFEQAMEPTPEQLDFLKTFDLAHGERRLRFVIDGLNHLYPHAGTEGYPEREQIDEAKGRLWEAVGKLRDVQSGTGFDETLSGHFDTCFAVEAMREFMEKTGFDTMAYVQEHRGQLDGLEAALREYLKQQLKGFTGRPLHQPAAADRGLEQRAPLGSPRALPRLPVLGRPPLPRPVAERRRRARPRRDRPDQPARHAPHPGRDEGQAGKLVGAEKGHFGAFLSRPGREQDYLWGRLDGAERFIGILLAGADDADKERWCNEAFRAILEEDEEAVPKASELVQHVRSVAGSA